MESEDLFNAVRSYVRAAIDLLSKKCTPAPAQVIGGVRRWIRVGETFCHQDIEQPYWVQCIRTHGDQLHSLEKREDVVALLRKDPEIASQLDQLIGTALSFAQLTTDQVADRLIWQVAQRMDGLEFDDEVFIEEY